MRVAGVIFDHIDDVDNVYGFDLADVPMGLLKTASARPSEPSDYALAIHTNRSVAYKYPINDPFNAYASAWYFVKTAENLPPDAVPIVAAEIANALILYDVPETPETKRVKEVAQLAPDDIPAPPYRIIADQAGPSIKEIELGKVEKTAAKLTPAARAALPDSAFALVVKTKDGRKIRKYPIHDEAHVRNALVRFSQFHHRLPPEWRSKIARRIKQAAKRYGIKISPENPINKYAADMTTQTLLERIAERVRYVEGAAKEAYTKIAEFLVEHPGADLEKVAALIEEVDRRAGLDKVWDVLGDPYVTKTAAKKQDTTTSDKKKQLLKKLLEEAKALDAASLLM